VKPERGSPTLGTETVPDDRASCDVNPDVVERTGKQNRPRRVPVPDPFLVALGEAIRARRTHLRLSQVALATAIGVSQRRIYDWEHGLRDVRLVGSLVPLAAGLNMTVVALLVQADVVFHDQRRESPSV
jgi:DNA-binding XRE family transcriptional regulator